MMRREEVQVEGWVTKNRIFSQRRDIRLHSEMFCVLSMTAVTVVEFHGQLLNQLTHCKIPTADGCKVFT